MKVRLRALRIRALETGPGRLVFTLGPDAALDPFLLAKHVQAQRRRLRLTPDMKLVAGGRAAAPAAAAASPRTSGKKSDRKNGALAARASAALPATPGGRCDPGARAPARGPPGARRPRDLRPPGVAATP